MKGCGKKHWSGETRVREVVKFNPLSPCGIFINCHVPVLEDCVLREESEFYFTGMFDQEYPLLKYTFRGGKVLQEFLQTASWSSGPVLFLALKDEYGEVVEDSLWTGEEIQQQV